MKISYNWLKWYVPEVPEVDKLADVFTYHLCEVESLTPLLGEEGAGDGDYIFDLNILPNRAHDLLSHQGIARELAGQLGIKFNDPTPKYKIPESKPTNLKINVESARRYMGRIVRDIKVGPSPEWVKMHLESIGARSINNIVDATNITMFDCGQPCHAFDLDKIKGNISVRNATDGEKITTLDNKDLVLNATDVVIADDEGVLALAGVKGGKKAEVDANTKNIMLEVANFFPISTRKTARRLGIFTDALKRFENDLSPMLCDFAMLELSALLVEFGFNNFENVVDIYPKKLPEKKLSFSVAKVSKILGINVSMAEVEDILKRYSFIYRNNGDLFEINVPSMRFDLEIEEDMAEEVSRILGYDKVEPKMPKISFKPKQNEVFAKISYTRNKLLSEGYSEVMTYTFCDKGEVSVLASASDKKFLRTNITDGLKESIKLNQLNAPFLGIKEIKVFEIGTVFKKGGEEMHVAYGDKKEVKEMTLNEFTKSAESFLNGLAGVGDPGNRGPEKMTLPMTFKMWSLYPFIVRDIAFWADGEINIEEIKNLIKENAGELVVKGPELFDTFSKDGKTSYAFRIIFQSFDRTLTDEEVNTFTSKISQVLTQKGFTLR